MTQQASTQGFKGSDTDALDKIVKKMKDAASFADKMVLALRALCAALDAMSWTGYAAALSAYLKSTVIPLLQTVSRNLKLFAGIVGAASSIQKDTSSNKYVIDAGDTGYVPVPISAAPPPASGDADRPAQDNPTAGAEQGAVQSTALDVDKLQTVASDIAAIFQKVSELAELADGDGVGDGSAGEQLSKLGELVQAIEKLIGGGDDTPGGTPDGGADGGAGSDPGTGGDGPDSGKPDTPTDIGTEPVPNPEPGVDPGTPDGTTPDTPTPDSSSVTVGQIWQAVTAALRELGLLSPDGTVDVGDSSGFDREAVAGQIDAIDASLDSLRESLGIETSGPSDGDAGGQFTDRYPSGMEPSIPGGQGVGDLPTSSGTPFVEPSFTADPEYQAGYSTGYSDGYAAAESASPASATGGAEPSYAAESGGGGGSSPGGGSGGGSPSYAPEAAPTAAAASDPGPVVYHATADSVAPVSSAPAASGEVQSRLVAMASEPASSSGSAVPLAGAAVAASLLGGAYARRARGEQSDSGAEQADQTDPQAATTGAV